MRGRGYWRFVLVLLEHMINKSRFFVKFFKRGDRYWYFYIQKIDLENKKVYLGRKILATFHSSAITLLLRARRSDFEYYIDRQDLKDGYYNIETFSITDDTNPQYLIGNLSLKYLYEHLLAGFEGVRNTDPLIPDFYRHLVPEENYIYLSGDKFEDIDCFGSTAVLKYDEFETGRFSPVIPYVVDQIRKATGAVKTRNSYYNRLKCRVWITRDGLDLTLGNTLEESRNGLGLLGLRLPYYLYPSLQEGESREVDIYSYVTLQQS